MRAVFIAGAHTDIGKTHVACALIRAARARGLKVEALKPLVSGFDSGDWTASDPGRLLAALGRPPSDEALAAISPWRFRAPLAPPMAAKLEGVSLDLNAVAGFCRERVTAAEADLMLVEGVGGVMSPVADDATGLDLMALLGLPALLVGGSYLGAISHTLTAVEAIRGRGLQLCGVVISESGDPQAPDFAATVAAMERFSGLPVIAGGRGAEDWADGLLDVITADSSPRLRGEGG